MVIVVIVAGEGLESCGVVCLFVSPSSQVLRSGILPSLEAVLIDVLPPPRANPFWEGNRRASWRGSKSLKLSGNRQNYRLHT